MSALDRETAGMLAETVAAYVQRAGGGPVPPGHLQTLFEQGWLQTALPEGCGGLGFGVDAAAIVAGALARGHLAEPVAATFMAARLMALAAPDCPAARALGEEGRIAALAWEDGQETVEDGGRLSGGKRRVAGVDRSRTLLVTAQSQDRPVLVEVALAAPGVTVRPAARVDGGSLAELDFDAAPCTVIAAGAAVTEALRRVRAETSLVIAAELRTHIDEMLALTLDHLNTRRQFGQSLGAFQALQHRAADLYLQTLLSRAVLERALAAAAAGMAADDLDRTACRARARLNDTALLLTRGSIQLFGALGTTEECPLSRHVKRVLALVGWLGTSAEQRRRYAALGQGETRNLRREAETA